MTKADLIFKLGTIVTSRAEAIKEVLARANSGTGG